VLNDDATSGLWIQSDPVGTEDHGRMMQPETDHTPGDGTLCFITANTPPGGAAGDADVDGGCTTLLSPVIDLSREREVFASWWYWLGKGGASTDDSLFFDVSTDGGESWRRLDVKTEADTVWQFATYRLDEATPITNRMRFRFQPCDRGLPGVLEAGLDDLSIEALLAPIPLPPPPPTVARLYPAAPNPCRGSCRISFDQPAVGTASVSIWDALGRRVRRLYGGRTEVGTHVVSWDGRDDAGRRVPSGVYFCRLDGPGVRARQALLFFR
jgi:hypothetical protein